MMSSRLLRIGLSSTVGVKDARMLVLISRSKPLFIFYIAHSIRLLDQGPRPRPSGVAPQLVARAKLYSLTHMLKGEAACRSVVQTRLDPDITTKSNNAECLLALNITRHINTLDLHHDNPTTRYRHTTPSLLRGHAIPTFDPLSPLHINTGTTD